MTPLARLFARRIATTGPMTVADYMAECLLHPTHGYYTTREPFGTGGDFTTAPEISQMFGEILGLCLAQGWLDQGAPAAFTLAEIGPGRGTLMADVLRATRSVPGFHDAARVTLIEASPRLRAMQRTTLGQHPAIWINTPADLPDAPLFLLANEFFDALPIRQFVRHPEGWQERVVGLNGKALAFGLTAPAPFGFLQARLSDTEPGEMVEVCPSAAPIIADLSARIARHSGLALVVDYGGWGSRGDTLQALRAHAFADPLAAPGLADLTAHVDFRALAQAAQVPHRYLDQGTFLERLGITARAKALAARLTGPTLEAHVVAHRRLTHPAEMGSLFKVLALYPVGSPAPAGTA
jgi:NADH dehydrogenase [ubiquinone] 1 alpha subcomplex assembly factor 7